MKRQRVHEAEFDLSQLDFIGVSARGRRLAPKPVAKLKRIRRENNGSEASNDGGTQPSDGGIQPEDGEDQPLPFEE